MKKTLAWFNTNSGAIQAISAIAIIVLTSFLVISNNQYINLTHSTLEINKNNYKQLVRTQRPFLLFSKINTVLYTGKYTLNLINVGTYPGQLSSIRIMTGISKSKVTEIITTTRTTQDYSENSIRNTSHDFIFGTGPLDINVNYELQKDAILSLRKGQPIHFIIEIEYSDVGIEFPQSRLTHYEFVSWWNGSELFNNPRQQIELPSQGMISDRTFFMNVSKKFRN